MAIQIIRLIVYHLVISQLSKIVTTRHPMKLKLTNISILMILTVSLAGLFSCTGHGNNNGLIPLTDNDKEWLRKDSLTVYESNWGNRDSSRIEIPTVEIGYPIQRQNIVCLGGNAEVLIRRSTPHEIEKIDNKFEASISQRLKNDWRLKDVRMHIRRTHKEYLDIFMSVERYDSISFDDDDIRFINRTLQPQDIILNGKKYKECIVIDSWDSDTLFYYDRTKNRYKTNNIDKLIWSKEHGLIYYQMENGEEFFRKFD